MRPAERIRMRVFYSYHPVIPIFVRLFFPCSQQSSARVGPFQVHPYFVDTNHPPSLTSQPIIICSMASMM